MSRDVYTENSAEQDLATARAEITRRDARIAELEAQLRGVTAQRDNARNERSTGRLNERSLIHDVIAALKAAPKNAVAIAAASALEQIVGPAPEVVTALPEGLRAIGGTR